VAFPQQLNLSPGRDWITHTGRKKVDMLGKQTNKSREKRTPKDNRRHAGTTHRICVPPPHVPLHKKGQFWQDTALSCSLGFEEDIATTAKSNGAGPKPRSTFFLW